MTPPPLVPDFTFSVGPSSLSASVGTISPPIVVSVAAKNGFAATVSVSINGLPNGVTATPASPIAMTPGSPQEVTLNIPASATPASGTLQFAATSGSLSKSGSIAWNLTSAPLISTYQNGSMVFLQSVTGNESARVGLLLNWGGTIGEVSLNGTNYVNTNDPGREVQPEIWDGDAIYTGGLWGWSVVMAGDHDFNGSPVLAQTVDAQSIYIKSQPLLWVPESFGGGSGNPVPGDIYAEQWVTPVPGYGNAFKVHFKLTHFGTDTHTNISQEFPAVYVNRGFETFQYYGGNSPWTYDSLSTTTMPDLPQQGPLLNTPEQWGAYADSSGSGLTVYTPGSYPYTHGFNNPGPAPDGTNYFVPFTTYTWWPGAVLESNVYLIAGPIADARAIIYALRNQETALSPFPANGNLEVPAANATVSGHNVEVAGWTFGTSPISQVEVLVDGVVAGNATYGISRPDISAAFRGATAYAGFTYSWDTVKFVNGIHSLSVRITDENGNIAILPTAHFTVSNP
jgi:hypothetical protein